MGRRREVVCGIDVGSTNTKIVAVGPEGDIPYRAAAATPRRADGMLHAPDLFETVETMLTGLADHSLTIVAACTAGVGEDGLLVGAGQEPLCDVLPWYHPDRHEIFDSLAPVLGDDLALPVRTDAARTIVGWRWAIQQRDAARARSWSALADWVAGRWAGRVFMSDTLAARTAAWVPATKAWELGRVMATLGDPDLLPEVMPAGQVVGPLRSARLSAAGVLSPHAAVVAGGHDHPLGGWAIHQLDPAAVIDSMGTAEVVVAHSPQPMASRTSLLDVGPGVQGTGSTVLAVQHLAHNVAWADRDPEVAMELRALIAGLAPPTSDVDYDTFVVGGPDGPPPRFTDDAPHDPRGRASAVLGGLARRSSMLIAAVAGTLDATPVLFATGGWARSPGWMSIKERIEGRHFRLIPEPEVTAVAAALLAAHAIGWNISGARVLGEPLAG